MTNDAGGADPPPDDDQSDHPNPDAADDDGDRPAGSALDDESTASGADAIRETDTRHEDANGICRRRSPSLAESRAPDRVRNPDPAPPMDRRVFSRGSGPPAVARSSSSVRRSTAPSA